MPDHFLPDSFLALVARDNNKANTSKGLILSINDPVIKSVAQSIVSTLIGAAQASTTPPPTTTTKNTQSQESTSIPASSDSSKPPTSISAPSTAISSSSSGSTNISTSSRISSASSQTASSQTATSSLASAPSDPASDLPTTTRTAPEQGPSQSQAQSQVLTTSAPTTATTMVTLTSTTQAPRQGRACYWPDGSVDTESIPCNPDDTVHSMCCQGGGKAACLDNGLCLWLQDRSVDRNSCTDKGWKDGACMKICMAAAPSGHSDTYPCPKNVSYACCSDSSAECCSTGLDKEFIGVAKNATAQIYMPGSVQTPDPSTSKATAATDAADCPASSPSSASLLAVGAGVGIPLVFLLLVALALLFIQNRQLRARGLQKRIPQPQMPEVSGEAATYRPPARPSMIRSVRSSAQVQARLEAWRRYYRQPPGQDSIPVSELPETPGSPSATAAAGEKPWAFEEEVSEF